MTMLEGRARLPWEWRVVSRDRCELRRRYRHMRDGHHPLRDDGRPSSGRSGGDRRCAFIGLPWV